MIPVLFYIRKNTTFCSWEVRPQQKMKKKKKKKKKKICFDHLTYAYATVKLNQITTAGLQTLHNTLIMLKKKKKKKKKKSSAFFLNIYRHYFFAYPFYVNNVYICRLVSHLSSKAPVVRRDIEISSAEITQIVVTVNELSFIPTGAVNVIDCCCVLRLLDEWQTVLTCSVLSNLGLYCLLRTVCLYA